MPGIEHYVRLIVTSFVAAMLWAHNGFDFPAAALPCFAIIFLVYGALILWELRVLLPPLLLSRPAHQPAHRRQRLYTIVHRSYTRSSTA